MSDIVQTEGHCQQRALFDEPLQPITVDSKSDDYDSGGGVSDDDQVPLAKLILSAHISLLLHVFVKDQSLRDVCSQLLPMRSFWLPIRILKAFITLHGRTGLVAAESMRGAIIALRFFEDINNAHAVSATASVSITTTQLQTNPLRNEVVISSVTSGKWMWTGRDFQWLETSATFEEVSNSSLGVIERKEAIVSIVSEESSVENAASLSPIHEQICHSETGLSGGRRGYKRTTFALEDKEKDRIHGSDLRQKALTVFDFDHESD